jgi:hypothetical protein
MWLRLCHVGSTQYVTIRSYWFHSEWAKLFPGSQTHRLLDIPWYLWHLISCRELLFCFQCKLLDYQSYPCHQNYNEGTSWPMHSEPEVVRQAESLNLVTILSLFTFVGLCLCPSLLSTAFLLFHFIPFSPIFVILDTHHTWDSLFIFPPTLAWSAFGSLLWYHLMPLAS